MNARIAAGLAVSLNLLLVGCGGGDNPQAPPIGPQSDTAATAQAVSGKARARASGSGKPGVLVWEDRYDVGFDQAFAVAALKDRVFVSGFARKLRAQFPDSQRGFVVRAYDRHTGSLLWQDTADKGSDDFASGAVTDGKRLFVSGTALIPGRGYDWLVRAYDPATGALLWEDVNDFAGGDDFSRGTAIAEGNGLLFLGGFATNSRGDVDAVVRAYDASSGAVVWQDQVDYGGPFGDLVTSLSVTGGRLFIAGVASAVTTPFGLFVRAYDARTGTLLWERSTTDSAPQLFLYQNPRVIAHDGRIFVSTSLGAEVPPAVGFVQSYDARSGALLWQDQIRKGGNSGDFPEALDVHGGQLFVVGTGGRDCLNDVSPPSNCDTFVRSYAAATGTLLWEREFDFSGVDDFATGIKAENGNVYVSSTGGPAVFPFGPFSGDPMGVWRVQAFKGSTGQLLWEDVVESDNTVSDSERALDLVPHKGQLFVVGRSIRNFICCDFIVRAYDTSGGK
jgi:outer membrane protein assembly factor BamB